MERLRVDTPATGMDHDLSNTGRGASNCGTLPLMCLVVVVVPASISDAAVYWRRPEPTPGKRRLRRCKSDAPRSARCHSCPASSSRRKCRTARSAAHPNFLARHSSQEGIVELAKLNRLCPPPPTVKYLTPLVPSSVPSGFTFLLIDRLCACPWITTSPLPASKAFANWREVPIECQAVEDRCG